MNFNPFFYSLETYVIHDDTAEVKNILSTHFLYMFLLVLNVVCKLQCVIGTINIFQYLYWYL